MMQSLSELVRAAQTLTIYTRRPVHGRSIGQYPTAWSGGGFSFRQLREYVPGDDIRFVDWKSTARMGQLLVRDYYDEQNRTFVIVLDCSASMQFASGAYAKLDIAGNIAASLAYAIHLHGDAVGYISANADYMHAAPPRSSASHVRHVMQQIQHDTQHACGRVAMSNVHRRIMHMYPRPTGVIYISDFLDDAYADIIKHMGYQHALMPIRIVDPQEEQLDVPNETVLHDVETGDRMTMTRRMRSIYRQWYAYHQAYFHSAMRRAGVVPCECYTDQDWLSSIRSYMRG